MWGCCRSAPGKPLAEPDVVVPHHLELCLGICEDGNRPRVESFPLILQALSGLSVHTCVSDDSFFFDVRVLILQPP
jgi:hypothetical protein